MKKCFILSQCLLLCLLLTGCGKNVSPNTYEASEVGVVSRVMAGTIIAKRAVTIDNHSDVGMLAGAATGAVGGSAIGGSGRGNLAGAIGGAVVGGVVGNVADKAINRKKGFEYIIKLKDGSTIAVAQASDILFQINQKVLVIYGAMTRIIPDDTAK